MDTDTLLWSRLAFALPIIFPAHGPRPAALALNQAMNPTWSGSSAMK